MLKIVKFSAQLSSSDTEHLIEQRCILIRHHISFFSLASGENCKSRCQLDISDPRPRSRYQFMFQSGPRRFISALARSENIRQCTVTVHN